VPAKLRVGVMLDDWIVPNWVHAILSEIHSSGELELSLVVLNSSKVKKSAPWQKLRNLRGYAFAAYVSTEGRLSAKKVYKDAFAPTDAGALLEPVPLLRVTPIQSKFVDRFQEEDLDAIRSANLDVLLRFGFRIIKGDILDTARYGVWSFHHGDNDFYRGVPPLFWEIYEDNPVSGTILQILNEQLDGGKVIYKSFAATHSYSLYMNRNPIYWKTAKFVVRKLRALGEFGVESLEPIASAPDAHPKLYRMPTIPQLTVFSMRCGARLATAHLNEKLWQEQWFVAIAKRTTPDNGSAVPSHGNFEPLLMPNDRFYADPCALSVGDREFIFFEDYSFPEKKGRISCATTDDAGRVIATETVLDEPFHLSYPFVFKVDDDYFMIPETKSANSVRLYRATEFPTCWKFEATLLQGVRAVDATIHQQDGIFWMFANVVTPEASMHDELYLFFAKSLFGPWTEHRQNPVVSDVRRARPAGRLFFRDHVLVRPAQDCSSRYGGAIRLNAVHELNPRFYRETSLDEIRPEWAGQSMATHTMSFSDRLLVTDGLRRRSKFLPLMRNRNALNLSPCTRL
jgi:hypothetical protein